MFGSINFSGYEVCKDNLQAEKLPVENSNLNFFSFSPDGRTATWMRNTESAFMIAGTGLAFFASMLPSTIAGVFALLRADDNNSLPRKVAAGGILACGMCFPVHPLMTTGLLASLYNAPSENGRDAFSGASTTVLTGAISVGSTAGAGLGKVVAGVIVPPIAGVFNLASNVYAACYTSKAESPNSSWINCSFI